MNILKGEIKYEKEKLNNWVWTKLTEEKHPDRKAGSPVHTAYMKRRH